MNNEKELDDLEPQVEPETCIEGNNGEVECEPEWNYEQQMWICLICGRQC